MNMSNGHQSKSQPRSVEEIIDEELIKEGWTREQLDEQKIIGTLLDEKLAQGYSMSRISAEWQGKTPQEILSGNTKSNGHFRVAEKIIEEENTTVPTPTI